MVKFLLRAMKKEDFSTSKFIDFDKKRRVFYNNLYIDDFKIVVKMPLNKNKNVLYRDIKIDKFDLGKYTYLLAYD